MKLKALVHTVVVAAVAASLAAVAAAHQGATPKVMEWQGKPLPRIKMTSVAGRRITNRTLKGKVVIIDFWATWCPPCRKASPTMQKMQAKYGKRGLLVIGADMGERTKTNDPAKKYAREHKYTYTFTYNNDAFAQQLGIVGIPTILIVDRHGKIVRVVVGYDDSVGVELERIVAKML